MIDKQALLGAVNLLVLDDAAPTFYEALTVAVQLPKHLPLGLQGQAELMTPLVELARRDRSAYEAVLQLIDKKREARGWPPLTPPKKEGFNKVDYQRQFMDQKRQRERRAAEIENMLRPERDKLIGNTRLEFMRQTSAKWKIRRDELVDRARAAHGGQIPMEAMRALLEKFWSQVDQELDEAEAEALRKIRG